MTSKLLCTDILAIRCIGDFLFVGIGNTLNVYKKPTYELELKLNCLGSHNIHGIVNGPNNNLVVFGSTVLQFYQISSENDKLILRELSNIIQFPDWIITTKWVSEENKIYLSILFAHNNVYIYNLPVNKFKNIQCKEKCILYGGSLSQENNQDIIIFSGTVFQEILIWTVKCNMTSVDDATVLHRLTGHNGVIFSVVYDSFKNLICSTSDDRTVRLWKVIKDKDSNVDWSTTKIVLLKTMFGHSARVWRALINDENIITIGEDSFICKWSFDGALIDKIQAHHGAPIWSIDVCNDNKVIYTGGADGACNAWNLATDKSPTSISISYVDKRNVPKYVCYLNSGAYLVFVEGGKLLYYKQGNNIEEKLLILDKYRSYCIMQVSPCRMYVALASRDGYITIYQNDQEIEKSQLELVVEENVMGCQIFSLQWLNNDTIIACAADGMLKILQINTKTNTIITRAEYILPKSRERWLTAAIIYNELLACGDRTGNMHIFKYLLTKDWNNDEKFKHPVQSFAKVHGKIGIQSFALFEGKLITTGRDGSIRIYEKDQVTHNDFLNFLYAKKMPMDWVGGNIKTEKDLLLLGFKEVEFMIYSTSSQRLLMRIPCGGGHRSWDCVISEKSIHFTYLRNKQIYSYSCPIDLCAVPIVLNGFHGKEIHSMQVLTQSGQQKLFVSGGEDCVLRITYISPNYTLQTLGIYDGHICSIKSIAIICLQKNMSHEKYLVFSCGGRAQMKIWRVDMRVQSCHNVFGAEDISCADLNSHMLNGKDKYHKNCWKEAQLTQKMDPETRYMDINVYIPAERTSYLILSVACADGFVRFFGYNVVNNSISLRRSMKCGNRCILKVHTFQCSRYTILLTMLTNGIVQFFNITTTVAQVMQEESCVEDDNQNIHTTPFSTHRFHQSGINCFDLRMTEENEYLLLTGGDDNLVNLVSFKISTVPNGKLSILELATWSTSSAHCTQITGAKFYGDNQFFTVGMDQRIIRYKYTNIANNISVTINTIVMTSIPDVQGLSLSFDREIAKDLLCVYGKGFELLSL